MVKVSLRMLIAADRAADGSINLKDLQCLQRRWKTCCSNGLERRKRGNGRDRKRYVNKKQRGLPRGFSVPVQVSCREPYCLPSDVKKLQPQLAVLWGRSGVASRWLQEIHSVFRLGLTKVRQCHWLVVACHARNVFSAPSHYYAWGSSSCCSNQHGPLSLMQGRRTKKSRTVLGWETVRRMYRKPALRFKKQTSRALLTLK